MLEWGRKLPHLPTDAEIAVILADLARTTQAREAGVCTESAQGLQNRASACDHFNARTTQFPWSDVAFSRVVRESNDETVAHSDPSGHWLLAAAWEASTGQRCWVWLHRFTAPWAADEAELLPYAAQKLVRWLAKRGDLLRTFACHATQQRLEHTAQITSKLSHDFGNLLTGIMGFTELSLLELPAKSPVRRHMKEVLGQSVEGGQWIHKLHRFCRRTQVSPGASTSLTAALAAAVHRLGEAHGEALQFESSLAVGLPDLRIDSEALQQLLSELLGNSAEAMLGAGTIQITAQPIVLSEQDAHRLLGAPVAGSQVEIVIQDTGPGLCDEARAKLFHEAYYSSKLRKRGLGLLIVHGLLMTHQGGFHWEQAPGQGLRTRVCLPFASPIRSGDRPAKVRTTSRVKPTKP